MGRLSEAISALERANALSQRSPMTVAAFGAALAAYGRGSEDLELVGELQAGTAHGRYVSGVWLGAIHAVLGDTERAMSASSGREPTAAPGCFDACDSTRDSTACVTFRGFSRYYRRTPDPVPSNHSPGQTVSTVFEMNFHEGPT